MVLDVVNKFRCRNSGSGIYKLASFTLHKGKCHKVTTIPRAGCYGLGFPKYFCCVEKRPRVIGENGRSFRVIF